MFFLRLPKNIPPDLLAKIEQAAINVFDEKARAANVDGLANLRNERPDFLNLCKKK